MNSFGRKLGLIGLFLGIVLGIILLVIQNYIAGQIIIALRDEVEKSCDCTFEVDSLDVSLLTLSAKAKNARILQAKKEELKFELIKLTFGINEIFDNKIFLNRLDLIDGLATGIGEESATYKFIDYLTSPSEPIETKDESEVSSPILKVILKNLNVIDTKILEDFGGSSLIADGVQLAVNRTITNDFKLSPKINHLKLVIKSSEKEIYLGKILGLVKILDNGIEYENLTSDLANSKLKINAKSEAKTNILDGETEFNFDSNDIELGSFMQTKLQGKGTLSQKIAEPLIQADFKNSSPVSIEVSDLKLFSLDNLDGSFVVDFKGDSPSLFIKNLFGSSNSNKINLEKEISIIDDQIKGGLDFSFANFEIYDAQIKDFNGNLNISGSIDRPNITVKGKSAAINYNNLTFLNTNLEFENQGSNIKLNLSHQTEDLGEMKILASFFLREKLPIKIQEFNFEFKDYSFLPEKIDYIEYARITGKGSLKGDFTPERISGEGSLSLSSRHFAGESALNGNFIIDKSILDINLKNSSGSVATNLNYSFRRKDSGTVKLKLDNFKANEYNPDLECFEISLDALYDFKFSNFINGDGQIDLSKLELGCNINKMILENQGTIKISTGEVQIPKLKIIGQISEFEVLGSISKSNGYNIKSQGFLNLESIARLIKNIDDLQGDLTTNIELTGSLTEPKFKGYANLSNIGFLIESLNLTADQFDGKLILDQEKIKIDSLAGNINSGFVELSGFINPFNIPFSELNIKYDYFEYFIDNNTNLNTSGLLNLAIDNMGIPLLSGNIFINQGSFQKEIGFRSAIKIIKEFFVKPQRNGSVKKPVELNLDINLSANRNLYIISNLIESELDANINLRGPVSNPIITGELNSLYGWFGLKNSRFDLTSGRIVFSPASNIPTIELLAETNAINQVGEPIYIILEARGLITEPNVTLISDNNLPEKDILSLLTSRGPYRTKTKIDSLGRNQSQDLVLFKNDANFFTRVFSDLTTIDSISLEPTFNNKTGLVEPTLIATKNLTNSLHITSETHFGGDSNDSRFRANYDLTDRFVISGIFDSVNTQRNTTAGVDLIFTVLSKKLPYLEIEFTNTEGFKKNKLLEALRLSSDSRIKPNEIETLKNYLKNYLKSIGYLSNKVDIECQLGEIDCKKIIINPILGNRFKINEIRFIKDLLPDKLNETAISKNDFVTDDFKNKLELQIIRALRNEGYIKARVKTFYELFEENSTANLVVDLYLGQPVTFVFNGNNRFSAKEFLETINLFTRKQAFGNNTINILIENIEKLYRNNGYLFTTVSFEELYDEQEKRNTYQININEESKITNPNIEFIGLKKISLAELKKLIKDDNAELFSQIFNPEYIITEQLEANVFYINEIFLDQGFNNFSIQFEVIIDANGESAIIRYILEENEHFFINNLQIENFPDNLELPNFTPPPYSIPKVNKNISILLDFLTNKGYKNPSIDTEFNFDQNLLTLKINVLDEIIINSIKCRGNKSIKSKTIFNNLLFEEGDRLDRNLINRTKTKLLKLGLFSHIDIILTDISTSNLKDLEIIVTEKPMQTLEVGIGANSELGFHVFGEAINKSLFKDGRTVSLRLDAFYDEKTAEVTQGIAGIRYADPYFLGTDFKYINDIGYQKFDNPTLEFDLDRTLLDNSLHRSWGNGFGFTVGHSIIHEDLRNVSPGAVLSDLDTGNLELSYGYMSLSYDLRNDPLNPERGIYLGLDTKLASEMILSDANYYGLSGRFSWLIPFENSNFSLANNSIVSSLWTYDGTEYVPISQRNYLGGRNSIRGFEENSLGPKGDDGAVIGGDFAISNNFEIRYKANPLLSIHTFFDFGNTYLKDLGIDLDETRESVGVGFRFLSPIGPIGFDVGRPLDRQEGESPWRVHFNVGSNF